MDLIRKVANFIEDKEIKLLITSNSIYVANYTEIVRFNEKIIIIKSTNGEIDLFGQNLMITKLLNNEILIVGKIKKIEIR